MNKYTVFIALGLSSFSGLYTMQQLTFTHNDSVKLEVSAAYAPATIAIYQNFIDLNNSYNTEGHNPILTYDTNNLQESINFMYICPQNTCAILQECSKSWRKTEIARLVRPSQEEHSNAYPMLGQVYAYQKQLHELYLEVLQKAYTQISTSYASQTKDVLVELWYNTLEVFQKNLFATSPFTRSIQYYAAKQLIGFAQLYRDTSNNPLATFKVLQKIHTINALPLPNDASDTPEAHHANKTRALLQKCDAYYKAVIEPGTLE